MTPKEKAEAIVKKYRNPFNRDGCIPPTEYLFLNMAKQCALIAVDEIRDNLPLITDIQNHWLQVKQEIEQL
jgi:hypothetical protein